MIPKFDGVLEVRFGETVYKITFHLWIRIRKYILQNYCYFVPVSLVYKFLREGISVQIGSSINFNPGTDM